MLSFDLSIIFDLPTIYNTFKSGLKYDKLTNFEFGLPENHQSQKL